MEFEDWTDVEGGTPVRVWMGNKKPDFPRMNYYRSYDGDKKSPHRVLMEHPKSREFWDNAEVI